MAYPKLNRTNVRLSSARVADVQQLRHAVVFRDLELPDLSTLAGVADMRHYDAGQLIEGPDEGADVLFVVANGVVRLYLLSTEGREYTIGTRVGGEIFTLGNGAMDPPDAALAQASAPETVVYAVPWPQFLDVVAHCPSAAIGLASLLRQRLLHERRLLRELAFSSMHCRLARALAAYAAADPHAVVTLSREELAALAGTRSEEISRALRHFMDEGLITYRPHSRAIHVLNRAALDAY